MAIVMSRVCTRRRCTDEGECSQGRRSEMRGVVDAKALSVKEGSSDGKFEK